jgi:hypothetical protein
MQEAGQATCLLAWRGDQPAGRRTLLAASRYEKVRQMLGAFPEMNALEARPPGQGTGTAIITCAEQTARTLGAAITGPAGDRAGRARGSGSRITSGQQRQRSQRRRCG